MGRLAVTRASHSSALQRRNQFARWFRDTDNLLWALLIVLNLVPIWSFQYFPTQDGASHLANARIAWEYHQPDRAILREYYLLNQRPIPNLLGHFILVGLLMLVPPLIAEKILLSIYVILFGLATRYALGAARRDTRFVALLALVFVWSYSVHMGFYNFSLSVPMYLFVVGFWLRREGRLGRHQTIQLAVLLLLLFFAHFVSLLMAWITIGVMITWTATLDAFDGSGRNSFDARWFWNSFRARAAAPLLASLLPLALVGSFVAQAASEPGTGWPAKSVGERLLRLVVGEGIISYTRTEAVISALINVLFAVTIIALLVRRRRTGDGPDRWDGLGVLTVVCLLLYFFVPDEGLGGGYVRPRIYLFLYLAALLWLSSQSFSTRAKLALRIAAVSITALLLVDRWSAYARLSRLQAELVSAMHHIEPGSTLTSVIFAPRGCTADGREIAFRIRPFVHATGYIAAQKPIVLLDNYEAGYNYFPIKYRPEVDPNVHIGTMSVPSDLLSYSSRTPGRIDYVLVWGGRHVRHLQQSDPYIQSIFAQLATGYERVYVSPQNGLTELYRRTPGNPIATHRQFGKPKAPLDPEWAHCSPGAPVNKPVAFLRLRMG